MLVGPTSVITTQSPSGESDPTPTLILVVVVGIIVVVVVAARGPYGETSTPTVALFVGLGWRLLVGYPLLSVARLLLTFHPGKSDGPFHPYLLLGLLPQR